MKRGQVICVKAVRTLSSAGITSEGGDSGRGGRLSGGGGRKEEEAEKEEEGVVP